MCSLNVVFSQTQTKNDYYKVEKLDFRFVILNDIEKWGFEKLENKTSYTPTAFELINILNKLNTVIVTKDDVFQIVFFKDSGENCAIINHLIFKKKNKARKYFVDWEKNVGGGFGSFFEKYYRVYMLTNIDNPNTIQFSSEFYSPL